MPRVSIVIASYNHEKYAGECIQGVLDQTYQDFEIIITDDGSSDGTVNVIRKFDDSRIQLYTHAENKGACTAINNCIRKAVGEYIAVSNSDDAWEPTKLEKQVKYLDDHPEIGAVFTKVAFINESSTLLGLADYDRFYIFDKKNRSKYAWLNQFLSRGNCLCHPSVLIRRKCYDEVGLYDERMASLPDLDMWVRLCFKYEIHIIDEKLVHFRVREGEVNVSGKRLPNIIRGYFEYIQILNHYLKIKDRETFLKIFPEAVKYGEVKSEHVPYLLGMLALSNEHNSRQLWGLETLYNFLEKEENALNIEEKYGFRYRDFHKLTSTHDIFNLALAHTAPSPSQQPCSLTNVGNQNKLLKIAIRLHWMLAKIVLKFLKRITLYE